MSSAGYITVTLPDGDRLESTSPKRLVEMLHDRAGWNRGATPLETKGRMAEAAAVWAGFDISTDNPWDFLRDMDSAGALELAFADDANPETQTQKSNDNSPSQFHNGRHRNL